MRLFKDFVTLFSTSLLIALAGAATLQAQPAADAEWARVTEDDRGLVGVHARAFACGEDDDI